ncbi:inhibitor of nuclear factor kappa-B kinase subunit beta [Eupeodes corollae]|uniref:inhibitor of nuclear factor kappa-B kinase subunit beta n=1 Tax=Eupeodes corollae TaxID=290404 RepID=UPI002492132E|nr:inhibitor of nuclear factor kappa-B kinase subunit beta [Eupeodes corollae]
MSNHRRSKTNWKFIKELGSGAFGEVSLWTNTETGKSVAIKRCSVLFEKLALDEQSKLKKRWQQESDWMKDINIDNIVRACPELCADLVAEQNKTTQLPVIAMEYCDGGNLRSKLNEIENVNGFTEYDVRQVLGALRKAVYHLHDRYKITHRDIKPDNIVIKYNGEGEPIYKLTDMGYARILDKDTIVGSMVGSRNYFAPEIVESAEYKNSVDYWSMGIVAFEIICGVYPFLQDGSMYDILMSIKKKPPGCIAITKSNDNKICHHTQLFPENRLSTAFSRVIEPWLQLALEADGRKRGYEAALDEVQKRKPTLTFYTKLDDALQAKILTVFWLNRCKFLSYIVNESTTMDNLCTSIEADTKIPRNKYYFLLPAGHSLDYLLPKTQPYGLYEEKFDIDGKPMVYLVDFESNGLSNPDDPLISDSIRLTFQLNPKIHPRILKECLLNTLYLECNELRRVAECVNGIHEFAMSLESEIIKQEKRVNNFQIKVTHLNGQAMHFEAMIIGGNNLLKEKKIANVQTIDKEFKLISQNLETLTDANFTTRLKSLLVKTREFMSKSPLNTYKQEVDDHVKNFQNAFEEVRNKNRFISPDEIRKEVCSFLKIRKDFFDKTKKYLLINMNGKTEAIELLIDMYLEFQVILKNVFEHQSLWNDYKTAITDKTNEFLSKFGEQFYNEGRNKKSPIEKIVENMDTLDIDSDEFVKSVFVQNCDEESAFEIATDNLIKDTKILTQALSALWNV